MNAEDVTAEWLSELLGGRVGAVESSRIGDGLVGMNLRVALIDHDPQLPDSVVVKLPSTDPTSRMTGVMLRNYEREVKFYLQIADTVDVRVPQCHHGAWDEATGDFVLVLEDMAPAEQGDQVAGCDVATARVTVAELARLHGPRWDDPTLHEIDWLARRSGPEDGEQLQALYTMVFPQFAETFRRHLSDEAYALAEAFGARIVDFVAGAPDAPWAVTHGDFRLDNLLFGRHERGVPIVVVDWQTPGHGTPMGDLSYFCGAGLAPDDRRVHERELFELYLAALGQYHVAVDADALWLDYRRSAFGGVIMAVVASQIVGSSDRSEAMFAAMASRHLQHALDLDALALI